MDNLSISKMDGDNKQTPTMTHEEWQAFLRKFQECTCTPGSALACESCREYNRKRYADNIPFFRGDREVIE